MKLRKWQSECISEAYKHYSSGARHFLTLATPAAGKTIFATKLARELVDKSLIDIVVCFSPTAIVASDFTRSLSAEFNARFDGKLGAMGLSRTYQSMSFLDNSFLQLLNEYRVFVIFDEIHHCAGSSIENSNSWGEQIILKIQERAQYTLALTGTPWRSDKTPIVLANYCKNNKVICDYSYGLSEAINDSVCRVPHITALDNDDINVLHKSERKTFTSFSELIKHQLISYRAIVEDHEIIRELIQRADRRLNEIRLINAGAGGLIVASSVEHAIVIQRILKNTIGEDSTIVTYREEFPNETIQQYRENTTKWLISIGMVSEGTNIPRLQVCIHLTNIVTELHFRQILGRILRVTNSPTQIGYLFMVAHPDLIEFANRVSEDVPQESSIVRFDKLNSTFKKEVKENTKPIMSPHKNDESLQLNMGRDVKNKENSLSPLVKSPLSESYEMMLGIVGKFRDEVIALNFCEQ